MLFRSLEQLPEVAATKKRNGGKSEEARASTTDADARDVDATATSMVALLTYWLSFEYVRDPRNALEPANAEYALLRGAHHVLSLLLPYLEPGQSSHLRTLVAAYAAPANLSAPA